MQGNLYTPAKLPPKPLVFWAYEVLALSVFFDLQKTKSYLTNNLFLNCSEGFSVLQACTRSSCGTGVTTHSTQVYQQQQHKNSQNSHHLLLYFICFKESKPKEQQSFVDISCLLLIFTSCARGSPKRQELLMKAGHFQVGQRHTYVSIQYNIHRESCQM